MSLKRKAAHASVLNMETPDAKRRRGPSENVVKAQVTPQFATVKGLDFLDKLRTSADKHGSRIAKHFETLPDPDEYPDYYEQVKLPIALDTVEKKLRRFEYQSVSAVEADLKRMIKNAKMYNDKTAEAFNDAEKIRKMMSNYMKTSNPAYSDPSFTVEATPLPGEAGYESPAPTTPAVAAVPTPMSSSRPRRSLTLNGPKNPVEPAVETPTENEGTSGDSFQGKSFQQAQEMIIEELWELQNEEGDSISGNFRFKPPRALKDYYEMIKKPQSLDSIRKQVKGWVNNRDPPTGLSNYKSWAEFEADCDLIWDNAREYNEEGSQIVELVGQLEKHFKMRLNDAKQAVSEPAQPKLKLKMSAKSPDPQPATPKLTLNGPKPASSSGVSVDEGALRRQQELVKAGAGGAQSAARQSTGGTIEVRPSSSASGPPAAAQGPSQSPPQAANGIKTETQTPAPQGSPVMHRPVSNGVAAAATAVTTAATPTPTPGSMGPPSIVRPTQPVPPQPMFGPSSALSEVANNRFRAPGKTAADGILADVVIYSHPAISGLDPADRFHFTVAPSYMFTQQSYTFYVSPQHLWLQLHTIKKKVEGMRQLHLYCFVDNKKVQPSHPESGPDKQIAQPGQMTWQVGLAPGVVTRIELHAIAAPIRGAPKQGNTDLEFEKVTFFVVRELDASEYNAY